MALETEGTFPKYRKACKLSLSLCIILVAESMQRPSLSLWKVSRNIELGETNKKRIYCFHQREQQTNVSPSNLRKRKLERALRSGNPFRTGAWKCCSRYQCFKKAGADRCYEKYRFVNSMSKKQAKRYLISIYDQSLKVFRLASEVVCTRFLAKYLGFSKDMQCAIKNTPCTRGSAIARSRPVEVRRKTKRVFIAFFINRLAQRFGAAMPQKTKSHSRLSTGKHFGKNERMHGRIVDYMKDILRFRRTISIAYGAPSLRSLMSRRALDSHYTPGVKCYAKRCPNICRMKIR